MPALVASRILLAAGLAGTLVLAGPRRAHAQQDEGPFTVSVDPEDGSLEVSPRNLFRESGLVRALHSGLPLRIRIEAELWKSGFIDSPRGKGEWRATVLYDPLERSYRVATGVAGYAEITADSLPDVTSALRAAFSLPLRPLEEGRYYYLGEAQVETLSLSDLDELQRWLRGDLATASREDERAGSAVGRGMHRILVRMLGIPARTFRLRTEPFEFEARDPS